MINKLTKAQATKVNKLFKEYDKKNAPGCVMGIIKDKELIFAKGYGMADLEHNVPIDINTPFNVGSIAKQFTAACIHILSNRKKLSLNDTLSKYFPDFPKYAEKITISHLIHHTSGLRDWIELTNFTSKDFWHINPDEALYMLKNQQNLNHLTGEEMSYTNSGYFLLGKIVEKVSGMKLSKFAEKNIFKPLNMTDTHFHDVNGKMIMNRAHGYKPDPENGFTVNLFNSTVVGDGGLFTTVTDLLKWDTNFYDNSVGGKNFSKLMERFGSLNSGKKISYASGLNIFSYKGLRVVSHGGVDKGYISEFTRFPEHNFSVVIMTNREDIYPYPKCVEISNILLKDHFINEKPKKIKNAPEKPKEINLPIKTMKEYEGKYWILDKFISRKIYLKDKTLIYQRYPGSENELLALSKNEFKMLGVPVDARLSFSKNKNKEIIYSIKIDNREPEVFTCYKVTGLTQKDLKQLTGKFYSPEVNTTIEFRITENKLALFFMDKKISDLDPITNNIFNISGYIFYYFTDLKNSKYNGFKVSTNRCHNIKFQRVR